MVCEQLIAQGTEEFDYLRGEEEYKSQFGDLRRCTETVLLFRHANHRYAGQWIRSNLVAPAPGGETMAGAIAVAATRCYAMTDVQRDRQCQPEEHRSG